MLRRQGDEKGFRMYHMHENGKIITDSSEIVEILDHCRNDHTVFEAVDAQDNFYSLGLEEIEAEADPGDADILPSTEDPIQAVFKPLQQGASEMRIDCSYAFCFRHFGNMYSFKGKLVSADPDKFVLTYLLDNKIFRRQLRQSNRLTIDTLDKVLARIGNKTYRLINLSVGGVGVIIDDPDVFRIGESVPVKLLSEGHDCEAAGCVRHVAPLSGDGYVCGFSLTYPDEKGLDHIRRFIHQTRQSRKYLCRLNLLLR